MATRGPLAHGIGWDGPVQILPPGHPDNPAWNNDMWTLVSLIQAEAPVNRGILRTDLSARRARWRRLPKPRCGFQADVNNSYAAIRDLGGEISERVAGERSGASVNVLSADSPGGPRPMSAPRALRMEIGGQVIYRRRARGFTAVGSDYFNHGVTRWCTDRQHGPAINRWMSGKEAGNG